MNSVVEAAFGAGITERYEALFRLSWSLISNRDRKELFKVLARELKQVVQFDYLGVGIYDEQAHQVSLNTFDESGSHIQAPELTPEQTMTWWVYQRQYPLVISSLDEETRFPVAVGLLKKLGISSMCTLPVTTVHRRLGGLAVGSKVANAYNGEEISFLQLVANQVALALDDALNVEASEQAREQLERKQTELQRERDRLQLLLDITNQVVSTLELPGVLRTISASFRRVMECDGAGVLLPDCGSQELRMYGLDFPEGKGLINEGKLVSADKSPAGAAFRSGKPVVKDASQLSEVDPEACAVVRGEAIKSCCFIPLISRSRSVGVLVLARLRGNPFSEDEVGFLTQVAGQLAIAVENACAYRQIASLKDQLAQEKLYLEDEIRSELNFEEIIGESPALRRVLADVETVAPTDSTVLIYGETGTGKELIARAIHTLSSRQSNAFVKLNCAAIPTGLLESELFGHEKGAFTGAVSQRIGRFELAHRGTIFLDEISEIPLELQPKLLRVLQEREFERLGSARTLRSDARLIAASNRDLAAMVEAQQFRADLFYRLNVFPIQVPPLRERREDVPLLVRRFVQQFGRRINKKVETISSETMSALSRYPWPGNVRELQNVIERAVILSTGPMLKVSLADLKPRPADGPAGRSTGTLEEAERKHILAALEETNWVVGGRDGAAARLGLNRSTLQFRMGRLGLMRPGRASKKEVAEA